MARVDGTAHILLVDDSREDYEATVRAFRKVRMANPLTWCQDGDSALDFLHRRGRWAEPAPAPRPALILLDLNLPGLDGRVVLERIKSDELLRRIPVVVLTSSADERDIFACYEAGANSYVQKPVDFPGFVEAIQRLQGFWFEIALLPEA